MASATGIEVCSDSCLLAGIRPLGGGDAEIFAFRSLEGPYWPTRAEGIVQSLRVIRQESRLPKRAVVVAWEFDDGRTRGADPGNVGSDSSDSPRHPLRPDVLNSIEAAGFQVDSLLTPPEALLRLAIIRGRTVDTPVVWLVLNKCGASIAIVRGRDLLFSRSFPWTYRDGLKAGRAQALQRYSLVAHLAPEITHGVEVVRAEHGLSVGLIVTCGDLPDLRSLTMPLIEELDLEVETLDSTDGLRFTGALTDDAPAETAPALRLTTAAAIASTEESLLPSLVSVRAASVAVIALLLLVGPYLYFSNRADRSPASPGTVRDSTPQPIATQGRREPNRATTPESSPPDAPSQQSESSPTDKPTGIAPPAQQPPPPPLREPLPRIDTVLIDQDRRLALVDGGVVAVGDAIGSRVVVGIERDAIVLREPSGRTVKVRVRSGMKS
jgi:hypothetical protein